MRRPLHLSMFVLAALQAGSASAQHPMVLAKLQEINAAAPQPSTDQIKAAIAITAKAFGEANKTCVPTEIVVGEVAPITGARDVLGAVLAGQARNAWSAYVTHGGCEGKEPFRYMIVQKSDGSLVAPLVNEGRTFANPSIMRDTSAQAAIAALQKAKSADAACTGEQMKMGPTRIARQSQDLGPEVFGVRYVGSWSEVWRFETCGKRLDVSVEFTPDGDGGAYTNIKGQDVAIVE